MSSGTLPCRYPKLLEVLFDSHTLTRNPHTLQKITLEFCKVSTLRIRPGKKLNEKWRLPNAYTPAEVRTPTQPPAWEGVYPKTWAGNPFERINSAFARGGGYNQLCRRGLSAYKWAYKREQIVLFMVTAFRIAPRGKRCKKVIV